MPESPFWAVPREALFARVRSSERGLSAREAEERRAEQGPNVVALATERPAIFDLLSRFTSPLVLVLLVASGIAGVLGDLRSFVIIAAVVATSVLLDFVQERRARSAAARLRRKVEPRATVLRDGAPLTVPASELVVGDVVLLEAGDLVPADGRLLESNALQLQEAALTGEPYPVDKLASDLPDARTPLDADNAVFAGTAVVAGAGRAVIATIGGRTELARAAQALHHPPPPRPFERGTHEFGALIVRFTLILVFFVLMVHTLSGRPFLDSLLFALALAVGLTPELLPMIVSVTLARGALRMAEAGVIVKRLAAIHDLGSMDVLCTDKTGTLTEARVVVAACIDANGVDAPDVRAWARTCASLSQAHASPIDEALARAEGPRLSFAVRVLDEVPFDPVRRRSAMLVEHEGVHTIFVKGAAEDVLADCLAQPEGAHQRVAELSAEGMRVLALGRKDVPTEVTRVEPHDLVDLELFGFVALADPPKRDAREALLSLQSRGVGVKIVTGDHELVARHVARALDLPMGEALAGRDIDLLDDAALRVRVRSVDLFCRTTPVQKNRIVNALKAAGYAVGYLGDGINDGPPLRSADIGISVETAVDVAKDAADLILSRPDLGVLEQGVMEGRRTVANVTKYVLMATSSNFGNMVSMALASLFIPFLPLLPVQILVNNMLYDISEIALPFDAVDDEAVAQPRRWDIGYVRRFMVGVGPMSSIFDALTFFMLLRILRVDEATFRSGWFVESIVSQVAVIFVIRTTRGAFRSRPSGWLVFSSFAIIAVSIALPYSPLGAWLAFVPLPARTLGLLVLIVVVYLGLVELAKTRLMRWARSARATPRPLRRERG